jgi:hypothetical protein
LALSTTAPNGEQGIVTVGDYGHRATNVYDLEEHFMTEHEVVAVRWGLRAAPRSLLAIGAADANTQHAKLDLVRLSDRRFRPID